MPISVCIPEAEIDIYSAYINDLIAVAQWEQEYKGIVHHLNKEVEIKVLGMQHIIWTLQLK